MKPTEISASYQNNGYVLLKGVFNSAEIADFRGRIASLSQRQGDVLSHVSLRPILLDDRILEPVRAILGSKIVYFGDSAIRYEVDDGTRSFHRDAQPDFEDPSCTEYPVLRLGLYLQDHINHGGGLKVRRGSHRHVFLGRENLKRIFFGKPHGPLKLASYQLGPGVTLDIEPGDLVIWNLRTWHSGYAVRLRMFPKFCVNPRLEKYIPKALALPDIKPRAVIFASFGAPSANLDTFIRDRADHPSNREHWKNSRFDDSAVVESCAQKNVELRFDGLEQTRNRQP